MDFYQNANNNNRQTPPKTSGFSIAALVFGILAIVTLCTGLLPIPLGALGILFAVLTYRKGKKLPALSLTGLCLSCVGMVFGIVLYVYTIATFMPLLENPEYREELNTYYESILGVSLDELLGEYGDY